MKEPSKSQMIQRLDYAISQHDNAMAAMGKSGEHMKKLRKEMNREPVANFTFAKMGGAMSIKAYKFTNTSSDPDGTIVKNTWDVFQGAQRVDGSLVVSPTFALDSTLDYTVRLTVEDNRGGTDSKTVSIPREPVVVIGNPLSAHDFNDGTYQGLGHWVQPEAGAAIAIIDDPTNSGRGKVVRVDHARPALAAARDHNGGLYAHPKRSDGGNISWGDSFYMEADLWMPRYPYGAPGQRTADQRKLVYGKWGDPNARTGSVILNSWGRADGSGLDFAFGTESSAAEPHVDYGIAPLSWESWLRIGVQVVANKRGVADGILRFWLNRQPKYERTGILLFSPAPNPAQDFIYEWGIGNQEQWGDDSVPMRDFRLWDNIVFYTEPPF